jgi:hypothetical protein
MEASQDKTDVIIRLLFGGLVIHFAGIFHLSCSVQKFFPDFHARAMLKKTFKFQVHIEKALGNRYFCFG